MLLSNYVLPLALCCFHTQRRLLGVARMASSYLKTAAALVRRSLAPSATGIRPCHARPFDIWQLVMLDTAAGVADGVGSWILSGIDAGEYAKSLMRHACEAAKRLEPSSSSPTEMLEYAHSRTQLQVCWLPLLCART